MTHVELLQSLFGAFDNTQEMIQEDFDKVQEDLQADLRDDILATLDEDLIASFTEEELDALIDGIIADVTEP